LCLWIGPFEVRVMVRITDMNYQWVSVDVCLKKIILIGHRVRERQKALSSARQDLGLLKIVHVERTD
jgi:hypothetical protein